MSALAWVGAHARWILASGLGAALFLQDLAAWMRPTLVPLVIVTLGLAFMRIDMLSVSRGIVTGRSLLRLGGIHLLLAVITPALIFLILGWLGLPDMMRDAATYTYLGPPIASAAALALLLRLNAKLTLEFGILSSLLAPFTAAILAAALFRDALPIDPFALGIRLAGMIALAAAFGWIGRILLRPERIEQHAKPLDGIATLAMLSMIFPLFDGVRERIFEAPGLAAGFLILVFVLNAGLQALISRIGGLMAPQSTASAIAICAGNRNAAMLLAALPEAQGFALFVALYQVPMYLTPLLGPWLLRTRVNPVETPFE